MTPADFIVVFFISPATIIALGGFVSMLLFDRNPFQYFSRFWGAMFLISLMILLFRNGLLRYGTNGGAVTAQDASQLYGLLASSPVYMFVNGWVLFTFLMALTLPQRSWKRFKDSINSGALKLPGKHHKSTKGDDNAANSTEN